MTPDQTDLLDKARESAVRLMRAARKAGLTVLAQWLKDASVGCQAGVDFQVRALGDNFTTQTERKVIDSKPNTFAKVAETADALADQLGMDVNKPAAFVDEGIHKEADAMKNEVDPRPLEERLKEADAVADAIIRKGLLGD